MLNNLFYIFQKYKKKKINKISYCVKRLKIIFLFRNGTL